MGGAATTWLITTLQNGAYPIPRHALHIKAFDPSYARQWQGSGRSIGPAFTGFSWCIPVATDSDAQKSLG